MKTVGHPGAPPPNRLRRRKRNKHRSQHAQDENTPQTNSPCDRAHHDVRARVRRKHHERNPAGARGRDTSHTGQGGSGSDDSCHATTRPPCPVHPSSPSCAQARFMSSDLNRAQVVGIRAGRGIDPAGWAAGRAEGGAVHKEPASRRRVERGGIVSKNTIATQYQVDSGEEPAIFSSAASGDKRRASLLRVRRYQGLKRLLDATQTVYTDTAFNSLVFL